MLRHRSFQLMLAGLAGAFLLTSIMSAVAFAAATGDPNPRLMAVDVRTPFHVAAETSSDPQWCTPDHWTPYGGQWAFDIWADNGVAGSTEPNATGGLAAYLRVSPSTMSEGTVPDKIRARVSRSELACDVEPYEYGGYQQTFEIHATYRGQEIQLGSLTISHIDDRVYSLGQWIDDPMDTYIGTVFEGGVINDCWGGPHIHMEFINDQGASCHQGVCENLPDENIPVWGEGSIVGKLGGSSAGGQPGLCPAFSDDEKLPCATWDGDISGCDAHGLYDPNPSDDTQDCAFYVTSDKCRPRGTSNCSAGIQADCDPGNSETFYCSTWDGVVSSCDAHGLYDPNPSDDTQDCAYYSQSHRCSARGTANCSAGEPCAPLVVACPKGADCNGIDPQI